MAKRGMPAGFGGGMNANMMKQVQKMQNDMLKAQEELEQKEYTASSGGGAVSAVVSGKRELLNLSVSKDVVDPEDVEMLQDLIIAAVNQALREADETMTKEMSRYTGGLNLF